MKHLLPVLLLAVAVSATATPTPDRTPVRKIESAGAEKPLYHAATQQPEPAKRAYMQEPAGASADAARVLRTASSKTPVLKRASAKAPAVSADNLPDIRGAVYHSDIITGEWDCEYPRGIYSVNTPQTTLLLDGPVALYGGVNVENMYYATSYDVYYGTGYATVSAYDLENGKRVGYINGTNECVITGGAAYDPTTYACYGITYNSDLSGMQLTKIIYTSNSVTTTRVADLPGNWNSLAISAEGQIYAISYTAETIDNRLTATSSSLCKIDKTTGEVTVIGETGKAPQYLSSATIDHRSGRMFWNVLEEGKASVLCEVNLTTGKATDIFAYANNDEVLGMYIPAPEAADNAPAAVSNLNVSFPNGSLAGVVEFDAPGALYGGGQASGPLSYSIMANGVAVASGETTFGAHVNASVTLDTPANYEFIVTVSNDAGTSPKAKAELYVGHGVPAAPADVKLVREGAAMKLTWSPVTRAVDAGYIDPAAVTYTVTRQDGTVAASGIGETSFSEPFTEPDVLTSYSYSVTATNGNLTSKAGVSNTVSAGSVRVPYVNTFETADDMAAFTIIDVNGDGRTWSYYVQQKKAMCSYSNDGPVDDWLVTPPVKLEAGKIYVVRFTAACSYAGYDERLEVKWGNAPEVAAMTSEILPSTDITVNTPMPFSNYIIPQADGVYYVGFHSISDPKKFNLYLDDIEIREFEGVPTPAAVTNLSAAPDMNGALSVKVSFTAPTTDFTGNKITALSSIEVQRDGESVKSFENPVPGQEYSFTDMPEAAGEVSYTVAAFNEGGAGTETSVMTFVGIGKPLAPAAVDIAETSTDGIVTVSWQPVTTDVNGKTIPSDMVSYGLASYNADDQMWNIFEDGITACEYTFRALPEGTQDFVQYSVFAFVGDEFAGTTSPMIPAGTPFKDFTESFPDGYLTYPWSSGFTKGMAQWLMVIDKEVDGAAAQDGDNGFLQLTAVNADDCSSLSSGKISLAGCKAPVMSFFVWNIVQPGKPDLNEVNVYVRESRAASWTQVKHFAINSLGDREGWMPIIVPLDTYAGKTVEVRIEGVVKTHSNMLFDNILVGDICTDDLAVRSVQAPETVPAGSNYSVDVTIGNNTPLAVGEFSVRLLADGKEADAVSAEGLEPGGSMLLSFPRTMSPVSKDAVHYSAEVILATDARQDNNTSETVAVAPKYPEYPVVLNLRGNYTAGGVDLAWDAPELGSGEAVTVTEGFEDFEGFGSDPEGWTLIDRDQKPVGGFYGYPLPNITAGVDARSFIVFDTAEGGLADNSSFAPHSGKNFFASLYLSDDSTVDDWAISPYLSGNKQTVTLYAKSYQSYLAEHMSIYYSTGSLEPDDFVMVKDVPSVPGEWTMYSVELPEGARYMAIRSSATGCYMLMIDDITYEAGSVNDLLEVVGYNIYRNDTKLNEEPIKETVYSDASADRSAVYSVKVVYNLGESAPVSVSAMSSIDKIADAARVTVEDHRIVVRGADGRHVTVVSVDGKVILSTVAAGTVTAGVEPAFYIVTVGDRTFKVSVR